MKEQTVYALGFFDGVHLGHQALLKECRRLAEECDCTSGVMTFRTHPAKILRGEEPPRITNNEDRQALLFAYGIDTVEERFFDEATMETPWEEFMEKFLRPAGFVCGDDFHFGAGGLGTGETLTKWCEAAGIPCVIVPQQEIDGVRVSSTHIRSLLEGGKIREANRFLGHPHQFTGKVVEGRKLGRTIGIPTANLEVPAGLVQLPHGVYACKARFAGKTYLAVTNIGTRPTVNGENVTVEPWILDFEGDLYGKNITLEFHEYLRPEQKFDSLEELKAEIQKNAAQTRKILENS